MKKGTATFFIFSVDGFKKGSCPFFLSCFLLALPACAENPRVCLKDACYSVEIARTPETRERGLMERDGLKPGTGMLFIFEAPGRYGFWMKNMKFPIDILWIDRLGNVVYISENTPACSLYPCPVYIPPDLVKYVLEIPAGDASLNQISLSDKAVFKSLEH